MALSPPGSLLDDLAGTVDGAAREAGPGDDVAGVPARWVASPSTTEEAGDLLALAARTGTSVVVRGRGTALHLAPPPHSADLLVSTTRLDGVVEHEAGDLVCTVLAGTQLDEVNAVVGGAGQQLALDQPVPGSSVGGTLSTNRSGPRRLLYGTPRDLVLGVTMVRSDGVIAKAGGKVVKNVAGYDLGKLLCGAHGTLGLITRMVVRLHPLPQSARWVICSFAKPEAAVAAALDVTGSQVFASAVELRREAGGNTTEVCVLLEGTDRGVAGRVAEVTAMLGAGATPMTLDTAEVARVDADIDDLLVKVALPLTALPGLLSAVTGIERRLGLPCRLTGSAGAGVLYVVCRDVADRAEAAAEAVAVLRGASRAADGGGSAVVLQAPPQVRALVDSWGPVPALDLMRRVKHEFDPDGRFAAGRFVGGI
jgi:glycolate oxidase FAD binding subunit